MSEHGYRPDSEFKEHYEPSTKPKQQPLESDPRHRPRSGSRDQQQTLESDPRHRPRSGTRDQQQPLESDPRHRPRSGSRDQQQPLESDPRHQRGTGNLGRRHGPESQERVVVQKKVEGRLTAFFQSLKNRSVGLIKWSANMLVSGLLGAALFPIIGPVGATAAAMGAAAVMTSIQNKLKSLGLHLQEDTVHKLVDPFQWKQFDESDLRKVIEDVLSKNRAANEDLKQLFLDLVPT